jgi:acyl-CoA thioester hydrolase
MTQPNAWPARVRFSDVDLARVAHHGRYWTWCEEARFHFAEHVLGITRQEIEELGVYMPVVACRCRYVSPARWGDHLVVVVQLELTDRASLTFHHEILRDDGGRMGARVATAVTQHVFTNQDLELRLTVPELYRQRCAIAMHEWPSAFRAATEVRHASA